MIDAEGRNMRALTGGEHENDVPISSRDGKAVYFASDRTGRYELWKQDLASSTLTQVTKHGGFLRVESCGTGALNISQVNLLDCPMIFPSRHRARKKRTVDDPPPIEDFKARVRAAVSTDLLWQIRRSTAINQILSNEWNPHLQFIDEFMRKLGIIF
jgi:hypothetical protein